MRLWNLVGLTVEGRVQQPAVQRRQLEPQRGHRAVLGDATLRRALRSHDMLCDHGCHAEPSARAGVRVRAKVRAKVRVKVRLRLRVS